MLELYLDRTPEVDLTTFLQWITDLRIPYDVYNTPKSPKKVLSSYVKASHKQTGIWHMPLEKGKLRLLLSNTKPAGPYVGQCLKNKMIAASENLNTLRLAAMHELGHALKVVDTKRDKIVQLKVDPKYYGDAEEEQVSYVKKLTLLHPDGLIKMGGLHCLDPYCVMQPYLPESLLNKEKVAEIFCQSCLERLYKNRDKLLSEVEKQDTCFYCMNLIHCMNIKEDIWEETPVCNTKFAPRNGAQSE